jgi:hypothetical protein
MILISPKSTQKRWGDLARFPPDSKAIMAALKKAYQNYKPGDSYSMDKDGTGYVQFTGDDFPSDITVLKVKTELLTKDFQKAELENGLYNHHNVRCSKTEEIEPLA